MTEKNKKEPQSQNEDEPTLEAVQASEDSEQLTDGLESLKLELEQIRAKAAENLDGWQRAVAEFQNYKKRAERDNELMYSSMKGDIIKKILPALDDMERALQNRPSDAEAWVSGIELIHKKLIAVLEGEGVQRIDAAGTLFDPNLHEAISHEPSDAVESGYVIEVTRNGYLLGERVIRPAQVRVAK